MLSMEASPLQPRAVDAEGEAAEKVDSEAAQRTVLETIHGCYKLIMNQHLPTVQRWLKDLVKVCLM